MGCNKSKSQRGGSESSDNGEHGNTRQLGQETHSLNGENFECNQNGISNSGFHTDSALDFHSLDNQISANLGQQTGYNGSEFYVTGSFGDTAPAYSPNSVNNSTQYFSTDIYNQSVDGSSASSNNFSQEHMQGTYNQHQYHNQQQQVFDQEQIGGTFEEPIMGPPPRPVLRYTKNNNNMPRLIRPLVRRVSLDEEYRRFNHNVHCSPMVRHGSLENIPTGFGARYSRYDFASDNNLFHNSSFGYEKYSRCFNPKLRSSGRQDQQRGLKRNTWDDNLQSPNSPFDNRSGSVSEIDCMPDVGPRVKRRHSDIDNPYNSPADMYSNNNIEEKEEINHNNESSALHTSVKQLHLFDEPFDILDLLLFPEEWSSCVVDRTGLVNVSLASPEGKSVQRYFNRSSKSKDFTLCITAIERIENPFMHTYYLLKKQEMESRNEHVDELYLYHGTKKEYLTGILEDNLNWRLYSEKHRFGQGVSFSPLATYSSHYSDKTSEKVMLLFKVLASNSIGGSPDMKVPPIINNVVYDASIKDDTTVIVKYSDNEFYPLYKITYFKTMRN